jgi:HK97 family phage major capsid protein
LAAFNRVRPPCRSGAHLADAAALHTRKNERYTMTAQELREKRSKLLFDAHQIMSGEKVTDEQRSSVDKMLADANILKADIERLSQTEAAEAEQRSSGRIPRGEPSEAGEKPEADTRSIEERRSASNKALRSYLQKEPFEQRDLGVAANGGVMIPVGVTDPKIALQSAGSIYDIVGKLRTTSGEAMKVPYLNDVANGFVLNSAPIITTDPASGGVTVSIDDIRMNPVLIENSLINDVSFDLVSFVEKACQSRYLRTASKWITLGNTSNVGGLSAFTTGAVTAGTTLVTKYTDFTALLAALDPAYSIGACFLMSNATLANGVLNILDTNGRPIFLPFNDGGISGFAGTIFGYPVKLNPYQPNVGVGNPYIQFGNFEAGYTFREVAASAGLTNNIPGQGTIMLKRTDERYIELNKVGFVAFARVGGVVTNPGGVSGTAAPIVTLLGK